MRKRLKGWHLILIGFLVAICGFFYDLQFAGLPYQDPTPAMKEHWQFHSSIANWIILAGIVLLSLGFLISVFGFISNRWRDKPK